MHSQEESAPADASMLPPEPGELIHEVKPVGERFCERVAEVRRLPKNAGEDESHNFLMANRRK
jgi:hypothetical protein